MEFIKRKRKPILATFNLRPISVGGEFMGWDTSSESYGSFLRGDTGAWAKAYVNRLPRNVRNKKIADLHINGPSTTCDYGTYYRPSGLSARTTIYKPKTGLGDITYKITERTLNRFNDKPTLSTPYKSVPNKVAIPVRPDLVKLAALKPLVKVPAPALKGPGAIPTSTDTYHGHLGRALLEQEAKKSVPQATELVSRFSAPVSLTATGMQHGSNVYGRYGQTALPEIKRVDVQLVTKDNEIIPLAPVQDNSVSFRGANGVNGSRKDIQDFDLNIRMTDGTHYKVSKTTPRSQ